MRICRICGKTLKDNQKNACSYAHRENFGPRRGIENPNWKWGIANINGRAVVNVNGKNRYKYQVIMEEKLGRKLEKGEVVHHINGDVTDDRPENLQLFLNRAEHTKFEAKQRREKNNGAFSTARARVT